MTGFTFVICLAQPALCHWLPETRMPSSVYDTVFVFANASNDRGPVSCTMRTVWFVCPPLYLLLCHVLHGRVLCAHWSASWDTVWKVKNKSVFVHFWSPHHTSYRSQSFPAWFCVVWTRNWTHAWRSCDEQWSRFWTEFSSMIWYKVETETQPIALKISAEEAAQLAAPSLPVCRSVSINRKTGLLLRPELSSLELFQAQFPTATLSTLLNEPPLKGRKWAYSKVWPLKSFVVWWSLTCEDTACSVFYLEHLLATSSVGYTSIFILQFSLDPWGSAWSLSEHRNPGTWFISVTFHHLFTS